MPLIPNSGPARRTTIMQIVAFIGLPIACILILLAYALITLNM